MGADSSQISQSQFRKFWRPSESLEHLLVWENKDNPSFQLEQYTISPEDSQNHEQLYQLRRNCPYLVAAYALKEDSVLCGNSRDSQNVFIERMRLRLSNITDLPYPDILHLYDASLQGFAELVNVVGFFRVDEDQIGVNDQGHVKVWLSPAFESSRVVTVQNVTEQAMLQDIFQILEGVSDQSTYPQGQPTLAQCLSTSSQPDSAPLTFALVKSRFFTYIRQYCNSEVPTSLSCVLETGGTEAINNWCRQNGSFGFERNSLRLSEKVLQSKMTRLSTSSKIYSSQMGQNSQFVHEGLPVNLETSQEESKLEKAAPHEQPFLVNDQKVHYQLPEITQQALNIVQTTQAQPVQNQPPVVEPLRNGSRVFQPQSTIPVYIPFEPQGQKVVQQQVGLAQPQPQLISQRVIQYLPQNPELVSAPSQKFIQVVPTRIVNHQPIQQEIVYIQPQQNEAVARTQYNSNPALQAVREIQSYSNIQPLPYPQAIPDNIQQTQSRLQQQRVISQTIEIKDSAKTDEINYKLTTDYNYPTGDYNPPTEYNRNASGSGSLDWHDYTRKDEAKETNLEIFGRSVPNSHNVGEDRYGATEDGKSSPEFLALINELRSGAGKSRVNEVYSQLGGTPVSYPREPSSEGSKKKLNYDSYSHEVYSQQVFSSYQDSLKNIEAGSPKYETDTYSYQPESYSYKRYETSIDPELQADLLRYAK